VKRKLQTRIGIQAEAQLPLPLRRSKITQDVPFLVQNHSQSVRMTVAAAVEVARTETVAAVPAPKRKPLPAELHEDVRKVPNERRTERRNGREQPPARSSCGTVAAPAGAV
jgi:hypothetical protein